MLTAGGIITGLGIVGATTFEGVPDDDLPGAQGFTAKTAPSGSNPLVLVDVDTILQNDTAKAVTSTLLDAGQFKSLPDRLVEAFETGSQPVVVKNVGKLVLVGSDVAPDSGGAVVWADWTDEELLGILEAESETDAQTDTYRDRALYETERTSAAVLGETEFALGSPGVVRDIVDVWHGNAEPVGGMTLDSFERTPTKSHVRFTFDDLLVSCDDTASHSDVYNRVTQIYGWVSSTDEVRLRLRVESNNDSSAVASAVKSDFGIDSGDGSGSESNDTSLPFDAVENMTVTPNHDFVAVDYDPEDNEQGPFVRDVIETVVCLTGRSS